MQELGLSTFCKSNSEKRAANRCFYLYSCTVLLAFLRGLETMSAQFLLQYKCASHHSDSNAKWLGDIIQISAMSYLLIVVLQL